MFWLPEDTKEKFSIKEIIRALLNEIKDALKQYVSETEASFKKRLQKILITSIIGAILLVLIISLIVAAALFFLVGSLDYLSALPRWEAWDVMGLTSALIAGAFFLALFLILKKQLSPKKQK